MKKQLLLTVLTVLFFCSCNTGKKAMQSNSKFERDVLIDERDNKDYQTVKIGDQWWMAENLDYQTDESYYYSDNVRNSSFYGLLYTWDAALEACPAGWHLPTDEEWMILEETLGLPEFLVRETEYRGTVGEALKIRGEAGFNGLLGGWRDIEGNYYEMNIAAAYWTATPQSKFDAWGRGLEDGSPAIIRRTFGKTYGFSVRCVKD